MANTWASTLDFGGYSDWRLPATLPVGTTLGGDPNQSSNNGTTDFGYGGTASELGHLYYVTLGNLGFCTPNNAAPQSCVEQPGWGLNNTGPFTGLQSSQYWSGTEFASAGAAWYFTTQRGFQAAIGKSSGQLFATAVRAGDIAAAIPEPQTWLLMLSGLAALGVVRRLRR